jgi:hypothetical protein
LIISSSELEKLPNGFRFLQSLETVALVDCCKLESIPDDLVEVKLLREVRLRNCKKLTRLPGSWVNSSMQKSVLPQGPDLHEVSKQRRESTEKRQKTDGSEGVRLLVYGCLLLNDLLLRNLRGVHVVNEGLSEAACSFSKDEKQWWIGYWTQNADKGVFIIELCFEGDGQITGGGLDEVGQFRCSGRR